MEELELDEDMKGKGGLKSIHLRLPADMMKTILAYSN